MRRVTLLFAGLVVLPAVGAQTPPPQQILIKAGRLVDGRSATVQTNTGILIEGERIRAVGPLAQIQGQAPNARVIDLSQMTVLPGLIDAHTHLLLQGDVTSQEYEDQLLKQSTAYRAILAARNARLSLEHGFTAIRDLEKAFLGSNGAGEGALDMSEQCGLEQIRRHRPGIHRNKWPVPPR